MYQIHFRHDLNLLDIVWRTSFTPESVKRYADSLLVQFRAEGFAPGYRLRMDMSRSAAQPRDVLPVFQEQFRDFPKAHRIAIITPSTITSLQVRRMMTQPYLRIFPSAEAGLAWLLEGDAARDESRLH